MALFSRRYITRLLGFCLLSLHLAGCSPRQESSESPSVTSTTTEQKEEVAELAPVGDTVYPSVYGMSIKLMYPGTLHDGEADSSDPKTNWLGMFKTASGYAWKPTRLQAKRVKDEIVDGDAEETGWELSTSVTDSCFILVEANRWLKPGDIHQISIPVEKLLPGEEVVVKLAEKSYRLFAKGEKKEIPDNPGVWEITHYELWLECLQTETPKTTLLTAIPSFKDAMVTILFAGDLDQDGALDLILNTTEHYNLYRPTLYLSSPADVEHCVKPMGLMETTGC